AEREKSAPALQKSASGQPLQALAVPAEDRLFLAGGVEIEEVVAELADGPFPAPPVFPAALPDAARAVERRAQAGDALDRQLDTQPQGDIDRGEEDDRPHLPLAGPDEAGAGCPDQRRGT